jgi:hypothetical protein
VGRCRGRRCGFRCRLAVVKQLITFIEADGSERVVEVNQAHLLADGSILRDPAESSDIFRVVDDLVERDGVYYGRAVLDLPPVDAS